MQQHQIWLVDPSRLFREGLKMLLIDSPFEVTWEVAHVSLIDEETCPPGKHPAVVLIALHEASENGGDSEVQLARICQLFPRTAVVVLSDTLSLRQLLAAMIAGARAYLLRDIAPQALKQSLILALTGELVLPSSLVPMLTAGLNSGAAEETQAETRNEPSARERLILQCVASGLPNKVIANRLKIAEATVKSHMKTLFRKIRVRNRTEAAVWALGNGFHAPALSLAHSQAHPVGRVSGDHVQASRGS
jgi:two-component system nitrate/nitrite response regulator NarL